MGRVSKTTQRKLHASVLKSRKETLYKYLQKKNDGMVPCYVCHKHVKEKNATVEHIIPLSKDGTDDLDNLTISHYQCNQARGNNTEFTWDKSKEESEDKTE